MTTPRIVTVPYRGLRCRELSCQTELIMVRTPRDLTIPLERRPVELSDDERGLFVVVTGLDEEPTAYGLRAARELGLILGLGTPIYRAHWAGCTKAARFRR